MYRSYTGSNVSLFVLWLKFVLWFKLTHTGPYKNISIILENFPVFNREEKIESIKNDTIA